MKKLYSFYWDCGRMGDLEGIFTAEEEEVEKNIGKEVCFGEVLGKHSEIYGSLDEEDLTVLSDDQEFISKLEEVLGEGPVSGYNPIASIREEEEDE